MDIIVESCENSHVPWILSAFKVNINVLRIICILWLYLHSVDIIRISWKYPRSMDIIHILWKYPHFVDTIVIGHITSYLALNVCHVLHSFFLVVDIIFGHNKSYLARNVHPISPILLI